MSKTFTKTVLKEGSGPQVKAGAQVTVSADLYLAADKTGIWSTHKPSGFLFSASGGPKPFTYQASVGGVIKGWDDGVATMKVGERSRIEIPWAYAYGCTFSFFI